MKKFVKIAAAVAALFVGSSAFAAYTGDLQIRMGYSSETWNIDGFEIDGFEIDGGNLDDLSSNFTFDLVNYNTWKINDIVGVGFFDGLNFGAGDSITFDFMIGPAVSAKIGNIVRLETGIGFDVGCALYFKDDLTAFAAGTGFAWDFVAKFLPESRFSPIVGIRYNRLSSDKIDMSDEYYEDGYRVKYDDTFDVDNKYSSFRFFIGGCWNFGGSGN